MLELASTSAREEDWCVIEEFLRGVDHLAQDGSGRTLAHYAAENNQAEALKIMSANGCNLRTRSKQGRTPLDESRLNDCAAAQAVLLDSSYTPLESMYYTKNFELGHLQRVYEEHPEIVTAKLTVCDGKSLLMLCLEESEIESANWLLDVGANPGHVDHCGNTCLHAVVLNDERDGTVGRHCIMAEESNGLHPSEESRLNMAYISDLDSMMKQYSIPIGSTVLEAGCNRQSDPIYRAHQGLTILQRLLKEGADVNVHLTNDAGDSPILAFCETCADPGALLWALKIMQTYGTDLNFANLHNKMTAAMVMARRFGPGPWLSWFHSNRAYNGLIKDIEGLTTMDHLNEWKEDRRLLEASRMSFLREAAMAKEYSI